MASPAGEWAVDQWTEQYGEKPIWLKKEFIALARLESMLEDRFTAVWEAYLRDRGSFFIGHPPCKLLANLSQFQVQAIPARPAQPKPDPAYWTPEKVQATREHAMKVDRAAQEAHREAERRRNAHQRSVREAMLRSPKLDKQAAREALRTLRGELNKYGDVE